MQKNTLENNEEREFKLPVEYAVYGHITIKATSIEDAITRFKKNVDQISYPYNTEPIDGSYQLNTEDLELIEALQKIK